jgi:hypothetical protein
LLEIGACEEGPEMNLRCRLCVLGDRPERMEKALSSGADALILGLVDADKDAT